MWVLVIPWPSSGFSLIDTLLDLRQMFLVIPRILCILLLPLSPIRILHHTVFLHRYLVGSKPNVLSYTNHTMHSYIATFSDSNLPSYHVFLHQYLVGSKPNVLSYTNHTMHSNIASFSDANLPSLYHAFPHQYLVGSEPNVLSQSKHTMHSSTATFSDLES
jgi:hypothetical protein